MEKNSDSFIWKRTKSVRSYGHMMHKNRNIDGEVKLAWFVFEASFDRKLDWTLLFKRICGVLDPKYATLHLVTALEQAKNAFGDEADASYGTNDFLSGVPPFRFEGKGMANICWGNYFGPELAAEIPRHGMLSPLFPMEKIGAGTLICVTVQISDVEDDFPMFSKQREALRRLFR